MKIAVVYPPIKYKNEYPLLSQNRQFKYTNSLEVRIYPLVMASLATMLKEDKHDVLYLDGVNERLSMEVFEQQVSAFQPDILILETKAPIIQKHWEYINEFKTKNPDIKIILVGDHVCFYPEESLEQSKTDYVISHGDYDFIIRDLIRFLEKKQDEMPGDVHYKKDGNLISTGHTKFYNLDEAPEIDRNLTKWHIYGEAYLYHPVAYILSGRGCGGANNRETNLGQYKSNLPGRCTFCIWQYAFWKAGARMRDPDKVALEIKHLVENYKVKEVFDDNESGGVWDKEWLENFYIAMKKYGVLGKVRISSNARADNLADVEVCKLLKKLGYRLLKIGVESGNNKTLDILKKDEHINAIKQGIMNAKDYGLVVLMTTMVGYPWETEEETKETFDVTKELMLYKTHFGDSLQASIIMPYPGTPLYNEALKNKWFLDSFDPKDYKSFDMAHQILKTSGNPEAWCKKMWKIHLHPLFLLKSFFTLRSWNDIKLAIRGLISLFGHLKDYEE